MKRFFSRRERTALYLAADGRCSNCGRELEPGWHADHVDPYAAGGVTDVINGQALCPDCNLRKGSRLMTYRDTFQPRPFQQAVIDKVMDGMASGRRVTVVLAGPGSGKTLSYQAAANHLHREGLSDFVAVFVPRLVLARQCETKWLARDPDTGETYGDHRLFDTRDRLGPIRHTPNRTPIVPPNVTGVGVVSTYASLTNAAGEVIFTGWAKDHKGRFLLVADEAQFCGAVNDERSGGTRAGVLIEQLHAYSAHTLLLTGTPYRSDDQPLVLAWPEYYGEPNEVRRRPLLSHVSASYCDGVTEGYLRPFEALLHDARVRWRAVTNDVHEYDLSSSGADLRDVLRDPRVWQPIVDQVVELVARKQRIDPGYRGLISCMEQTEARKVEDYISRVHHGVVTRIAISDDGPEAEKALREFGTDAKTADILVTVRKAFIGYDCPQITVVGILTNYRDHGHLLQLVGRGLRVWKDAESCTVVAPDDPDMQVFIDFMRDESDAGMRERNRRELVAAERKPLTPDELGGVESAHVTRLRAVSNDVEVDHEELAWVEARRSEYDLIDDSTKLAKLLRAVRDEAPTQAASPAPERVATTTAPAATEDEQVLAIRRRTTKAITRYLNSAGFHPKMPGYGTVCAKMTVAVNREARVSAAEDVWTLEEANRRLTAVARLAEQGWRP